MTYTLHQQENGFTLLEVLVSVVVFIFGILALYRLQATVIQTNTYAAQLNRATATGGAKMEALLGLSYDSLASSAAPQNIGPFSINWVVTADQPVTDTKTVRVIVSWKGSKDRSHTLSLQSIKGK